MLILDKIRKIETKEISAKIARWSADVAAANESVATAVYVAEAAANAARSTNDAAYAAEAAANAATNAAYAARAAAAAAGADAADAMADFYARLASKLKELMRDDFSYRCFYGSRNMFEQLNDKIKIGCISESKAWWLENYEEVGKKHGYTEEAIKEYGNYIKGEKSC